MIKIITEDVSGYRFLAYVALMAIMALTAHSFIPPSSSLAFYAPLLKLVLLPLPAFLLLKGVKHRWPEIASAVMPMILLSYGAFAGSTIARLLS